MGEYKVVVMGNPNMDTGIGENILNALIIMVKCIYN